VFVANLNGDVTTATLRQLVPSNLGRRFRSLAFSYIQILELQALIIGNETRALADIEIEAGHWPCFRAVEQPLTSCPADWFPTALTPEWATWSPGRRETVRFCSHTVPAPAKPKPLRSHIPGCLPASLGWPGTA